MDILEVLQREGFLGRNIFKNWPTSPLPHKSIPVKPEYFIWYTALGLLGKIQKVLFS